MKKIVTVNADTVKDRISHSNHTGNLFGEHFLLVRESEPVMQHALIGHPMRLTEKRIMHILGGKAVYRIDLVDHLLQQGDFLYLPSDTVIEVESFSEEYRAEVLAIIELPGIASALIQHAVPKETLHISMSGDDSERMGDFFDMTERQMLRKEISNSAISHLVLAMLADAMSIENDRKEKYSGTKPARGEDIVQRFIPLVRQYGSSVRNIAFYADKLAVTPNHLSAVVRQHTGMSFMDWLHRSTIAEAKLLLRHSSMMVYEIAQRLQFNEPTTFNRYFRKHTGMKPLVYRNGK